jgi:hypothetical protein
MENQELAQQVLNVIRGNTAAIQQLSSALLSKDEARIKQAFAQVAHVELTPEQLRTVLQDYSTPEKVAAST